MKKISQAEQVIEAMRNEGGYATLRRLNEIVDFSTWRTKTPEASVRRIVQETNGIFRIQPGLWALEEMRDEVLLKFDLKVNDKSSEEQFSHGYYQGLLVEIGKYNEKTTYVPAQDKNRKYLGQSLIELSDTTKLPDFTYENLMRKAATVDVIWFNERMMPSHFYEVEHTTDIKNSLSKFYELQDFHAGFFIVAESCRRKEFEDKIDSSIYDSIKERVMFLDYNRVVSMYEGVRKVSETKW